MPNRSEKTELTAGVPTVEAVPWDQFVPLAAPLALPEFPVDALPDPLRPMVMEVAESVRIAPDTPAMAALTVASTCGIGRYYYRIADHYEAPGLWTLSQQDSGERKSAAFQYVSEPVWEWQRRERNRLQPLIDEAMEVRRVEEERLAYLRRQAGSGKDARARAVAKEGAVELAKNLTTAPAAADIIIEDGTPEGVVKFLDKSRGRGVVLSDEGGWLNTVGGRYAGMANVDALNKAYSGSPIVVVRATKERIEIPHPHLAVAITLQPEVIRTLAEAPYLRRTGFLARFCFSMPRSQVGQRLHRVRHVAPVVKSEYEKAIIEALGVLPAQSASLEEIDMASDAYEVWREFHDRVELAMCEGERLVSIREWASRAPGHVARIAGALHVVQFGREAVDHPISAENTSRAVQIGDYLIEHAIGAFALMGADECHQLAKKISGWIRRNGLDGFSLAQLHDVMRDLDNGELLTALELLEERHHVRRLPEPERSGRGRKPSPRFEVNPAGHDQATVPINTKITGNGGAVAEAAESFADDTPAMRRVRV